MKIFSVRDSKAEAFLPPFFAQTAGVAIRQFESAVNDESHDMHRFAEDYTLFELGEFDESSGALLPLDTPHSLGLAIGFIKPNNVSAIRTPIAGGE